MAVVVVIFSADVAVAVSVGNTIELDLGHKEEQTCHHALLQGDFENW